MYCEECGDVARVGSDNCFKCHIRSVGFTFHGASFGQQTFHNQTVGERQREAMSTNPNVEPI